MQIQTRKEFRHRLKEIRIKRDLNQTGLALKSGLTPSAICQYENGSRIPHFKALKSLAITLDISVDYLMFGIKRKTGVNQ